MVCAPLLPGRRKAAGLTSARSGYLISAAGLVQATLMGALRQLENPRALPVTGYAVLEATKAADAGRGARPRKTR